MAVDWSFMDDDEEPKAPAAPKEAPKRSAWGELVNALSPRNVLGSAAAGIGDIADLFTAPNTFTNPNPQEGKPHRSIAGEALTAAGAAPEPGDPYAERMRRRTGGKVSDSRVGRVIDSGIRGVSGALVTGPGALTTAGVRALPKALGVEAAAGGVGGMAGEIGDEVAGTPGRAVGSVLGGLTGGVAAARFLPPVKNAKVTSPFGHRTAPKAGASSDHRGIDFRAPIGTPVQASADGVVINRGSGGKAGNWIEVDYGNGVTSKYLHLHDANVKVKQRIKAGDVIARTGKSGNVTGPHLHWSVYKNGKPVDPMSVAFEGGGPRTPQGDVVDPNDFNARGVVPDEEMIDDALDGAIAKSNVPEFEGQEQEFAFQRAIAEKATQENLDPVELGASYLRGDNPDLITDINTRAQGVLDDMYTTNAQRRYSQELDSPEGAADQLVLPAGKGGEQDITVWSTEGLQKRLGAVMADARGTVKAGDNGEPLPSNVVSLASRRKFASVDDEIDYLDEVIAQNGPDADAAANRQDQLMAQQSAARHAAQEARKPPKAANDPGRRTAEEMTDDPVLQASIRAEDAYNDYVGWGDVPGVPEPKRGTKAHKAWMAKHDELWAAKEKARTSNNDNTPQSRTEEELARRFDEFAAEQLKDPEFKAKLEKIWADAHEAALGPSGPEDTYTAAMVRQKGGTGRNWSEQQVRSAVDAADEAVGQFWQGHVDRIKKLMADESGAKKASDEGEVPLTPKGNRAEEIKRIAEDNNIDLAAARALYHSTPAGGGATPPLPPSWGRGGGGDDGEGTPPPRGPDDGSPDDVDVVTKLTRALREAVSLRKKEDTGYARARGRKFSDMAQVRQHTGGVEGFYSELGALRGELPHQDFSAIMEKFTQDDLNELFDLVKTNPRLGMLDTLTARKGLMKMMEGRVPTDNEIDLLSRVFPKSMINDLMSARPKMKKFMEGAANVLNVPRALMASFDMSAPLRQGIFLAGRKQFYPAFGEMFKHLSKQKNREITDAIIARPTYKLMQKAGLALADIDSPLLMKREEDFMSNIAEKVVPGVRMSNQAYSGFLNTLRADVFDSIIKHWNEIGFDYKQDPRTLKSLGKYLNTATGRGDLGQFNQAVPFLNTMLFSPRLIASRLNLMNPVFYARLDPMVQKQAFRDLLSFGGAANVILGLTSLAAGAGILGAATSVELDPRSTDFAKIKTGDTRMEFTGGFQPYIRLGSQLAAYGLSDVLDLKGHVKSSTTGKLTKLNTGKYGAPTVADKIGDFLASKESPVLSFLHEQFGRGGQNVVGEKVPLSEAMLERVTPMFVGGAIDAYKEYGPAGLVTAPPSFFGVGVQTYKAKPKKAKASKNEDHWAFMEDSKSSSEKQDWSWME